jgi:hypothetical protein
MQTMSDFATLILANTLAAYANTLAAYVELY